MSDVKNGSHGLAYTSNDQKPQTDLAGLSLDLRQIATAKAQELMPQNRNISESTQP